MEKNEFKIGILQGRLSPSLDGRFQFFPKDWQQEFSIAKEIGFSAIEWLFDWPDFQYNPILGNEGRKEIAKIVEKSGVKVSSICTDYYMKYRFWGQDATNSVEMLKELISAAQIISERLILIPFLEGNAPKTDDEKNEIILNIKKVLPEAEKNGIKLAFETEMGSKEISNFISKFDSENVGVYYDIGNAASYGFDCPSDITLLGRKIFGIHAKDRKVNTSQSVILGKGDADYQGCIESLKKIDFSGTIIMQAWRDKDYLSDAKNQLLFLKKHLTN